MRKFINIPIILFVVSIVNLVLNPSVVGTVLLLTSILNLLLSILYKASIRRSNLLTSKVLSAEISRLQLDDDLKVYLKEILTKKGLNEAEVEMMTEGIFKDVNFIEGCRRIAELKTRSGQQRIKIKNFEKYTQSYIAKIKGLNEDQLRKLDDIKD